MDNSVEENYKNMPEFLEDAYMTTVTSRVDESIFQNNESRLQEDTSKGKIGSQATLLSVPFPDKDLSEKHSKVTSFPSYHRGITGILLGKPSCTSNKI